MLPWPAARWYAPEPEEFWRRSTTTPAQALLSRMGVRRYCYHRWVWKDLHALEAMVTKINRVAAVPYATRAISASPAARMTTIATMVSNSPRAYTTQWTLNSGRSSATVRILLRHGWSLVCTETARKRTPNARTHSNDVSHANPQLVHNTSRSENRVICWWWRIRPVNACWLAC